MRWRRLFRKRANPFSDALALSAMDLIGQHIRTAYAEPRNAAAREAMMIGATQAGLAFSNSFGRAGAWHVAADRRAFPCAARPVQRHAAAGDHALLHPWRRSALRRGRAPHRFRRDADGDAVAAAKLVTGLETLNKDLSVPTPPGSASTKRPGTARWR